MRNTQKAYVALATVCFLWGTTYLAARIGVAGFPALLFMALRNTTAGLLLLTFAVIRHRAVPGWPAIKLQIIPGLCMITFGTGIVGWAVRFIPSGLAALICSLIPLFTIVIQLVIRPQDKLNGRIVLGMLMGFLGVLLVFRDHMNFMANRNSLMGIGVTLFSCLSFASGGLYTQTHRAQSHAFFNAAIQMLVGGTGLLILSALAEDWQHLPSLSLTSGLALLYLIVFGSIVAFVSYLYAMSQLPAGLVSVYAYINPLVAIILGYLILHEHVTWITGLAFTITMLGVYLVNQGYRLQQTKKRALVTKAAEA
ncbi:EamA family transporter [Siphonobacter sp. SORGH_AS_0500]|uniref:EamA family transporter n=1 Tax=Siphonobacter sp. SORGH_AS_0500 TaxID=1864824 RepID=UPI0028670722|nr:EamA family transporter [Siphonobacter sp. SORGH_AS_0500]MDR6196453.1 drug/metabolite transporter (DMT)-like permease [Siphonobacter sp. SORGH_AS_0500]